MKASTRRAINRCTVGILPVADQQRAARSMRAEWQEFLERSDFEFAQDALSHETVSLEDAGFEEDDNRAIFGFAAEGVSSGIRCVCDAFYEEDSAEFMSG